MRKCPACKTQYSDDTLKYCLQDGTPLTEGRESDIPTVALGETETAIALGGQDHVNETERATWQQSQVTHVTAPPANRSKVSLFVIAAVVLFLLMLTVGAIALTFLRNFPGVAGVRNTNASTPASNSGYTAYPTFSPTPWAQGSPTATRPAVTPYPSSTVDTSSAGNDEQTRGEISQRVYGWKSSLESRDFNGYMGNYASTVDYYNRRGVSSATIRADKARAFSLYDSMRVNVSNISVSVDSSGDRATADFDKEWAFSGGSRSEGKTRSQLEFRRINGRWLISAERDLKLYYKR